MSHLKKITVTLNVPARYICALKLFAAENDIRQKLNGIVLEIGRENTYLVASDAYVLGCLRLESEQPEIGLSPITVIIPNRLLENIKPKGCVEITLQALVCLGLVDEEPESCDWPIAFKYDTLEWSGKTMNEKYLDWRQRCFPKEYSGKSCQFHMSDWIRLDKAARLLSGRKRSHVTVNYNGQKPALVDLDFSDFIGLVSPRLDDSNKAVPHPPDWLQLEQPPVELSKVWVLDESQPAAATQ
jgi:hypothetical protein